MKAVILCGGEGTRMRPLTYSLAKHLIPIANRPVIELILETIKDAGISETGIVVSPSTKEAFKAHLEDGPRYGVQLAYIVQQEPKGLAHAVQCAKAFVGDEPFLLYLGDNLLENGVKDLVSAFRDADCQAAISLARVVDPRHFGVARLEGGAIKELLEKPKDPPSNLAIVGTYVFDSHIFAAIGKIKPSQRGELEITDAIQQLIDDGYRVIPHRTTGWWKDVGKPDDMIEANRLLLENLTPMVEGMIDAKSQIEGKVAVGKGAQVRSSRLVGPVLMGKGTVIENSVLGPHVSIGDGATIKNSKIENSIVLEGAAIESMEGIDHSLIGRYAGVKRASGLSGYCLLLGDRCQVHLP